MDWWLWSLTKTQETWDLLPALLLGDRGQGSLHLCLPCPCRFGALGERDHFFLRAFTAPNTTGAWFCLKSLNATVAKINYIMFDQLAIVIFPLMLMVQSPWAPLKGLSEQPISALLPEQVSRTGRSGKSLARGGQCQKRIINSNNPVKQLPARARALNTLTFHSGFRAKPFPV